MRAGTGVALRLLVVKLKLPQGLGDPHGETPNPLHKLRQDPVLELVLGVGVATREGHQCALSELVVIVLGGHARWTGSHLPLLHGFPVHA